MQLRQPQPCRRASSLCYHNSNVMELERKNSLTSQHIGNQRWYVLHITCGVYLHHSSVMREGTSCTVNIHRNMHTGLTPMRSQIWHKRRLCAELNKTDLAVSCI